MATSTLQELGALHLTRPAADASVAEVAAWHELRGVVLDHLAEATPTVQHFAVSAHARATALLTGGTR